MWRLESGRIFFATSCQLLLGIISSRCRQCLLWKLPKRRRVASVLVLLIVGSYWFKVAARRPVQVTRLLLNLASMMSCRRLFVVV